MGLKAKKRLINSEIRLVRVYEFISLGLFDITHSHGRMDGWTDGPTDRPTDQRTKPVIEIQFIEKKEIVYSVGLDVNMAGLFGFDAINFVLNVVIIFALIGMVVTIVETRLQIIGRLGKIGIYILFTCHASVQFI